MTLSDVSIKRPVFTTMMSVCLIVMGLIGYSRLGTDLFPDVSFPFVMITTVYRGAGPQEVEGQVVKPIEDAIAGISGIDTVQSFSRENVGLVFAQFKLSVPLDRAVQETRDKVAGVQNLLPKDADAPRIERVDLGATPILTYAVSSDLPTAELRRLIEDKLEPTLKQTDGVAQVRLVGGDKREIRVSIDLDKAKSAGIAPMQIAERIGMENIDVPAGRFDLGASELSVRALGQFLNVEELGALPIVKSLTGTQTALSELAEVEDTVADKRTIARLNGDDSVVLEIVKQPGSNTVDVAARVKEAMQNAPEALKHNFKSSLLIDASVLIEANTHEVWIALVFGGLMAIFIILIFLLDLRGTIISSLALPTSVVGTFFVMYALGYSLNQMTLLALSLAIGLLIDDAVVVREAITHRLELGESPMEAASKGTKDVFLAVLATTLSLVAVFVPVAFMPGLVGQFFKQFGLTISAAVLISMFISFTLDPMLSARFSKARVKGEKHVESAIPALLRRMFESTERGYGHILKWTLSHPKLTALMTILVIAFSLFGASTLGNDFMVPQDRATFIVTMELKEGASVTESAKREATALALLKDLPDVKAAYSIIGADPNGMGGDANNVRMRVLTKPRAERALGLQELKAKARELLSTLPATKVAIIDPPDIEGLGDFFPIMIYVMGNDFNVLKSEANRIAGVLNGLKSKEGANMASDVRVLVNPSKPELAVAIDRRRANDTGLTSAALGMQMRLAMNGQIVGKLREGSVETNIVVKLAEKFRLNPEALKDMDVFTPVGPRAVGDVANIYVKETPAVIEHFNRERRVMIVASPGGVSLGEVATALKDEMKKSPPPAGYSLFYDGQMKVLDEQNSAFGLVLVLAFAFVYMVLASQFESFKHPFTIMVSAILGIIGALLALVITRWSLTLGAMIGLILVMGLVTKNAILLVDQILVNLREGMLLHDAVLAAGPRRLRPILMTSAAMAIGMVPTAVGRGQGFEFRAPMAVSVIGGVITSTFLTLIVVPSVFVLLETLTPKSMRIGLKKKETPVEPTQTLTEEVAS
jgi:hydrophobic/amphiphilic exporter-1 (mainly G- bacteria), HAE1 family